MDEQLRRQALFSVRTWLFKALHLVVIKDHTAGDLAEHCVMRRPLGHENMGIISEIGSGVTLLKKGDRVVLPFNVADGRCLNCEEGNTAFCTGVNPGFAGGGTHCSNALYALTHLTLSAYGYVAMGPYAGGQV